MSDPYQVLGVDPSASDDEVRNAYRDLARKYHPDKYTDNPLSELAEEKMKEINEAYDQIKKMRASGSSGSYGGSSYGGSSYSGSSSGGYGQSSGSGYGGVGVYGRIRQYIAMGNLAQAEQMLRSVPEKTAEWYFLYGAICSRKGWYDEALRNFRTASEMDPSNGEYRQAVERMESGGMYRSAGTGGALTNMSPCDCCSSLICADCCCECMGGDLIPCC